MLCCCGQCCLRAWVCQCVCVAGDWVSGSRLIPVDLQSCCINYEKRSAIKNGGEVRKRLLLHRWRGWIWNTSMCNLLTCTHTLHPPSLPPPPSPSRGRRNSQHLALRLHKISKAQKKVLTRQKFLIPFYKIEEEKKEKQSSRGDFHSNINSSAGEFPMSAAIKACQIKCDTGGRREKYSNHLPNLFCRAASLRAVAPTADSSDN